MAWYYLNAANEVCGPVDFLESPGLLYGWRDGERLDPTQPHGVRPCGWERVARTEIAETVEVSTVFLGLDHSFGEGSPLVFESMAFWGVDYWEPPTGDQPGVFKQLYERHKDTPFPQEWDCVRTATWAQALEAHEEMVARVREALEVERQKRGVWDQTLAGKEGL